MVAIVAALLGSCAGAPQIIAISPARGASGVPSRAPVVVTFDRPMDEASVGARFRLQALPDSGSPLPPVAGRVRWPSARQLVFDHPSLRPSGRYQVVLGAGYRDAQGMSNGLRHSWTFRTEGPPALTGSSPGPGSANVEPTASISLTFSRAMDTDSLRRAVSLLPAVPLSLHPDPGDGRRVTLSPASLLEPDRGYRLTVSDTATDVDGNRLSRAATLQFTTGRLAALQGQIGFIAVPASSATAGAAGEGVWVVDQRALPRPLVARAVSSFAWAPDGSRVLLHDPNGAWSVQALQGSPHQLTFQATWAGILAPGLGYAYIDGGHLRILSPDGSTVEVASDVNAAAVAPGGTRLAFAVGGGGSSGFEIRGYEVPLRTQYHLETEQQPVNSLTWSPDGLFLAYRVVDPVPARSLLKALGLQGSTTAIVAARGEVSPPTWDADSRHLVFTATLPAGPGGGAVSRAFLVGIGSPPPLLTAGLALPGPAGGDALEAYPSPDGRQIALVVVARNRAEVWIINADGSGLTQLTRYDPAGFPFSCRGVAWTPS